MSWLDKIETDFTITTGDGLEYTPSWINASRSIEFNTKEFNFIGVEGTFVDRRKAKGFRYSIELYFQGENHLEEAAAFLESSKNERYWIIKHPFYDNINVHPVSLSQDNKALNVSKITGVVLETIASPEPNPILIPEEKIEEDVDLLNESSAEKTALDVDFNSTDNRTLDNSCDYFHAVSSKYTESQEDKETLYNYLNNARNAIDNSFSDANSAITEVTTLIQAPALFKQSIESRLKILTENFNYLRTIIAGTATNIPLSTKKIYETLGGVFMGSICLALSKPYDADFKNMPQVDSAISKLLLNYSNYLTDLDTIQSGSGGDLKDFIADGANILAIDSVVIFTASNLFLIAKDAKQEHTYFLKEDSDLVSLTYKLYGSIDFDEKIEELKNDNGFGIKQILNIAKGTSVKYYV